MAQRQLSIDIAAPVEDSYFADGASFVKGNVAIDSQGIAMKDNPKRFTLLYEELEIGDVLGRGSSGVVVQALHVPTGTPLALKVINMFEKGKRDQLMREICSLYDAQCPSIIQFYGAFYREGAITIALEYMDGGSLANVLAQVGPIPEPVLAHITFQILWGLAYLQHEKRVHRDIKPSNLLISSTGEVRITDFGVSAELHNSIAMCGTFVGTYKYMSPERVEHQPYSFASDIWSFGLVLLECATGEYPYREDTTAVEMAQTILESAPPTPDPEVFTGEFCDFVAQCLHRDPGDRLPAEVLLGAPWLMRYGASSYEDSVEFVRSWIEEVTGGGSSGK